MMIAPGCGSFVPKKELALLQVLGLQTRQFSWPRLNLIVTPNDGFYVTYFIMDVVPWSPDQNFFNGGTNITITRVKTSVWGDPAGSLVVIDLDK